VVFIDDILIYSRSTEEHTHHLKIVLEVLRKNELYAKLKNSEFWLEKVAFLGYVVSNKRLSVDPQKIEAIMQYLRPKNTAEVRSVMGFAGYYHRFIQNLKIVTPLTNLMRRLSSMSRLIGVRKHFKNLIKG